MELSTRLKTIADLVNPQSRVADIGTDHGYIPVYLVKEKGISKVLAMDINKHPLSKCQSNIDAYQVQDKIKTRLSNGLTHLEKDEVDTVIIAGMGGKLICNILEKRRDIVDSLEQLILSPHSDIPFVRHYLVSLNRQFIEIIIKEDTHLYHIFNCSMKPYIKAENETLERIYLQYGKEPVLLKNPVYLEYLEEYIEKQKKLLIELTKKEVLNRMEEVTLDIKDLKQVITWIKS